jgi:hypothetical protein
MAETASLPRMISLALDEVGAMEARARLGRADPAEVGQPPKRVRADPTAASPTLQILMPERQFGDRYLATEFS